MGFAEEVEGVEPLKLISRASHVSDRLRGMFRAINISGASIDFGCILMHFWPFLIGTDSFRGFEPGKPPLDTPMCATRLIHNGSSDSNNDNNKNGNRNIGTWSVNLAEHNTIAAVLVMITVIGTVIASLVQN